jgi:AcrR family transcriptional regulator
MGRPPRIDRGEVLTTALALADEHGLDAVTMGAVAAHLGVTPMALYRHVTNKADLLDGVVELLLTEFDPPPRGRPGLERLAMLARNVRATARRHPSVFPLLLQRPVTTAEAWNARGGVYAALEDAGVPGDRIPQVERLISTAILGFAVSEVSGRFRNHSRRQLDADFDVLRGLLGQFVTFEATSGAAP